MLRGNYKQAGSTRFAIVVTLVVLLVWGSIGLMVWYVVRAGLGWVGTGYARIEIAPNSVVWVQVSGSRARLSTTKEGLASAQWQRPTTGDEVGPEMAMLELPLGGEKPEGWERVVVGFESMFDSESACWQLTRQGDDGVRWQYTTEEEVRLGGSLEHAPLVRIPAITRITLEAEGEPQLEEGEPAVGVALTLTSRGAELTDVSKDGDSAQARVRVFDENGEMVAEETGSLDDFGFT